LGHIEIGDKADLPLLLIIILIKFMNIKKDQIYQHEKQLIKKYIYECICNFDAFNDYNLTIQQYRSLSI